jgi:hypothetical protein
VLPERAVTAAGAALLLYVGGLVLAFGWRALALRRATGDAGFRDVSGRPGSVEKPRVHIGLSYRMEIDEHGTYPMVTSSFVGLFADEAMERPLIHRDYERNKPDDYPEAHLQIIADSPHWAGVLAPGETLPKLHFPVGSRRYRPCLEDVIEFLIREDLAQGREGWQDLVAAGRADFHRRQMRAAIRRDPDSAIDILRELGKF